MSDLIQIRVARTDDIPALCQLLHALFSQEAEFIPNANAQRNGLAMIIDRSDVGHILVARRQQQIVAMVSLLYSVSTALGGKVAMLEDMVVSADARGAGIGSELISYAIEFARAKGCKRVTLLTDRNNYAAHRFYHRHGFSPSTMIPLRLVFDAEKTG